MNEFDNLLNQIKLDNELTENKVRILKNKSINHYFEFEKKLFDEQLQRKIDKLNIRQNILRFKYSNYKNWYDNLNIIIIFISAVLTMTESIKSSYNISNEFLKIVPIIISSLIGLIATFIKFKKYQEKMENMARCLERCVSVIFRLKRMQEYVYNCKDLEELLSLQEKYMDEPYENYISSREEIEKNLKYKELVLHMETYRDLALRFQDAEAKYRYEKKKINYKLQNIDNMLKDDSEYELEGHSMNMLDRVKYVCGYIFGSKCCSIKNKRKSFTKRLSTRSKSNINIDIVEESGDEEL